MKMRTRRRHSALVATIPGYGLFLAKIDHFVHRKTIKGGRSRWRVKRGGGVDQPGPTSTQTANKERGDDR